MVRKPIDYKVGKVQLNPHGGEPFGLTGIIPGGEKGRVPYPSQMEIQFSGLFTKSGGASVVVLGGYVIMFRLRVALAPLCLFLSDKGLGVRSMT